MKSEGVFPRHQYVYRKGLGTCDSILDIVYLGKAASDQEREKAVVQIDFRAVFDVISHSGLLHELCDVGDDNAIFDIVAGF